MKKTLMQSLLDAGYPAEEIFHHESDLYVYATKKTNKIISEWCRENNLSSELFVNSFRDNITGRLMYDIPFAYIPWWEEKCGGGINE